jgi:hypothetical protein
MQKKKLLAALIMGFIAISAISYIARHKRAAIDKNTQSQPQQGVEEILAERAKQASRQLETPLGKALAARNWVDVQKNYNPEKDYIILGDCIRALFLENKMKDFKPEDTEKLVSIIISTFEQMDEKNMHLSGMLVTQFDRMPSPQHDSESFKTLKRWANNPKEPVLRRKMGITKLVLHDAKPENQLVDLYKKALINGDTFGSTHSEWIQKIDEIRSQPVQTECVELLAKNFKKIPAQSQPAALFVLSHHISVRTEETKILTLQFLETDDPGKFEAALRSLPPLINGNHLKEAEKAIIVKKLTNIPAPVRTPFVEMKSSEILKLLGHT